VRSRDPAVRSEPARRSSSKTPKLTLRPAELGRGTGIAKAAVVYHRPPRKDGECIRRYNVRVSAPTPQKSPPGNKHPKHPVYALETTGLLLIAILLLILTLIRYWHNINWSAR